jgi:toxin ParE1/3/4
MRRQVLLTEAAEQDLEELRGWLSLHDSAAGADHMPDRLLEVAEGLAQAPERGSWPRELSALGIREYRQVSFKPYRVIYRLLGGKVIIYLIADGRRDLQALLARRLLGA